mmetsp:Transcript_105701/g.182299  ORF Transcript_105701/g.182299 Transcript_105701/m.182299 type:complete len:142 (-) Transcript_105701:668-1093(-)
MTNGHGLAKHAMMADVWNMMYLIKTRLTMLHTKHNTFWVPTSIGGRRVGRVVPDDILHTKHQTFTRYQTTYLRQLSINSYTDWLRCASATSAPISRLSKLSLKTDMLIMLPGFDPTKLFVEHKTYLQTWEVKTSAHGNCQF